MTWRALVAMALLTLPAGAWAGKVTVGDFTYLEQSSGALYRGIHVKGDADSRFDIAVVGDGFTESEQITFDDAVYAAITELFGIPPYDEHRCSFNIWLVNLVSDDSGIDEGSLLRDTPLDCRRAVPGQPASFVTGDFDKCRQACDLAEVPARDAIYVMVNSTAYGAYAYPSNNIVFTTRRPHTGWFLAHELAHVIAELDDEYRCRLCDGSDDGRLYMGTDPEAPNLTTVLDPLAVKWSDLITYPADPVPTTPEITCNCDDVGIWAGGGYYAFGIYRPSEYCLMDGVLCAENDTFCKVCRKAIRDALVWCPGWNVIDSLAVKNAPSGMEHRLVDVESLIWSPQELVSRRIEPCGSCQEPDPRLTIIVIELPNPRDGALTIIDDLRNEVAVGAVGDGVLTAEFVMNPARTYYALIDPGPPTADALTMRARISIDGNPVNLRR